MYYIGQYSYRQIMPLYPYNHLALFLCLEVLRVERGWLMLMYLSILSTTNIREDKM